MDSDAALLTRYVASRDAEAFAALARRYARLVYNAALRVTDNKHDAEEVAQECFLALARQAGTVRSSLPGWLHSLAVSRAKDSIRGNVRRRNHEKAREVQAMSGNSEPAWTEVAPKVDDAIAELPDELRQVIVLHFLQGQTQAEMAAQEGVSQPTISRQVEKAIEALRDALRKRGLLVATVALTSMLAANTAEAAPAALLAGLGKMAASGMGGAAKAAAISLPLKIAAGVLLGATALTAGGIGVASLMKSDSSRPVATTTTVAAQASTPSAVHSTTTSTTLAKSPSLDPKLVKTLMEQLGQAFAAVEASMERGDAQDALAKWKATVPQTDLLLAQFKGTRAEKPLAATLAKMRTVQAALEKNALALAKQLLNSAKADGSQIGAAIKVTIGGVWYFETLLSLSASEAGRSLAAERFMFFDFTQLSGPPISMPTGSQADLERMMTPQATGQMDSLRAICKLVILNGDNALASGDRETARAHYQQVYDCGKWLATNPESLSVIKRAGEELQADAVKKLDLLK